jgi:uncharacterized protein with HEPN domain
LSRDPRLYLEDIQLACQKIVRYTRGMNIEQFRTDDRTYDAVIRNLEIIGEAARNIADEIRLAYPSVEWRAIAALRNIIAHEYFGVKDEIVWDLVENKISILEFQISRILRDLES